MAMTVKYRSFTDERRANSLWLVCETAAIPVGTRALGETIAAELPCTDRHEVMTLDLRPINWDDAWTFWLAHAYAHSANSVTRGVLEPRVSGSIHLDAANRPESAPTWDVQIARALVRAIEIARTRKA